MYTRERVEMRLRGSDKDEMIPTPGVINENHIRIILGVLKFILFKY